ncbi:hypothetical protein Poli38472_006396 [Pythium oligandrum]|uniref:Uncharacterized protein n=1 Tax=Pythium oligandrum TaxID=41045 RepID=A0A8K1FBR1_PYTOL|nr:hypothetical protein Poli38472_006396 [Pythium oligandrum]|eukprot:TMW56386.1 hypothetical protein Poli38472_006396 [Pythium oligandrum]
MDGLPSEPPGDANPETQARIARFLEMQRNGKGNQTFQDNLQTKKDVANPYILDKVVEYFGIDELQSNFAPEVFDPHGLPLHEFSDKIAMEQKKHADDQAQRLHASQFQRNEVQFVSAKQPE